nr:hypothetical protein [Tanacetum cinerariifolium]
MEDMMLELLEVCRQKEFYCMHDNVDDLIESALNFKLLSINLRSQCLDKKKQEAKNIVEQPTKRGTRIAKSLQNFRVKKSSISLNNTSQISPVNTITPVLPTEDPEYSLSMGYEHLSTILETESDEVIESSVEKLVPIPSEYEVTSEDESECDMSVCENHSENLSDSNNDGDILSDDNDFEDIEFVEASLLDLELVSLEEEHYVFQEEKYSYFENSVNSLSYLDNSLLEFETFSNPTKAMRSGSTTSHANNSHPEVDLFLASDNSIPLGIENFGYDSEGDIHFLEELLVDDYIPIIENESSNFDHENDLSFPRPPLKPPDVEFFFVFEPNSEEVISDKLNEDECFDPGREIDVLQMLKMTITFSSYLSFEFFYHILSTLSSYFENSVNSLSYLDNSLLEFETFSDPTEATISGSTTDHANNSHPEYDLFCFEIKSDQGRLTSVVMKDISDDSTNDPLLEEDDLFLTSDNSIPSEEVISDKLNEDECFNPGREIDVFANVEDDDYFFFIFAIRIFLPYLIYPDVSPLLISTESEDTISLESPFRAGGISSGWNFHDFPYND